MGQSRQAYDAKRDTCPVPLSTKSLRFQFFYSVFRLSRSVSICILICLQYIRLLSDLTDASGLTYVQMRGDESLSIP